MILKFSNTIDLLTRKFLSRIYSEHSPDLSSKVKFERDPNSNTNFHVSFPPCSASPSLNLESEQHFHRRAFGSLNPPVRWIDRNARYRKVVKIRDRVGARVASIFCHFRREDRYLLCNSRWTDSRTPAYTGDISDETLDVLQPVILSGCFGAHAPLGALRLFQSRRSCGVCAVRIMSVDWNRSFPEPEARRTGKCFRLTLKPTIDR